MLFGIEVFQFAGKLGLELGNIKLLNEIGAGHAINQPIPICGYAVA